MNWQAIQTELEKHVALQRDYSRVSRQKERAQETFDEHYDRALRALQTVITRRANAAAKTLSDSWCVRVRVRPLIDHRDNTSVPYAILQWACRGGEFTLRARVTCDAELESLLARFRRTVIINRDAPPKVKA